MALACMYLAAKQEIDRIASNDLSYALDHLIASAKSKPGVLCSLLEHFRTFHRCEISMNLKLHPRVRSTSISPNLFNGVLTSPSDRRARGAPPAGKAGGIKPRDRLFPDLENLSMGQARKQFQGSRSSAAGPNVSTLRPADILLCSLGNCNGCGGVLLGHVRAISCPSCDPLTLKRAIGQLHFLDDSDNSDAPWPMRTTRAQGADAANDGLGSNTNIRGDRQDKDCASVSSVSSSSSPVLPLPPLQPDRNRRTTEHDANSDILAGSPEHLRAETPRRSGSHAIGKRTTQVGLGDDGEGAKDLASNARLLIRKIRERFFDQPQMVEDFITVMQQVIGGTVTTAEGRQRITKLMSSGLDKKVDSDVGLLSHIMSFLPHQAPEPKRNDHADVGDDVGDDFSVTSAEERTKKRSKQPSDKYCKFSEHERGKISDGVSRFGLGSARLWQRIAGAYHFKSRTAVNIKDAWRTMRTTQWKTRRQELDDRTPSKRTPLDFTPMHPACTVGVAQ